MAVTLTFSHPLNISVNIGDVAFRSPTVTNVYDIYMFHQTIGVITDIIGRNTNSPQIVVNTPLFTPFIDDFIFDATRDEGNSYGLKGYDAEGTMEKD